MYAITDLVFSFTCLLLLKHFHLKRDRASNFMIRCYIAMAIIQVATMGGILMDVPGIALLYRTSIIGINLAINSLCLILTMRVFLVRFNFVEMQHVGGRA